MKTNTAADLYCAATVALLLILTAWGNAVAMLVIAVLGLGVGLLIFGRQFARRGALAALVGFVVALAVAVMVQPH